MPFCGGRRRRRGLKITDSVPSPEAKRVYVGENALYIMTEDEVFSSPKEDIKWTSIGVDVSHFCAFGRRMMKIQGQKLSLFFDKGLRWRTTESDTSNITDHICDDSFLALISAKNKGLTLSLDNGLTWNEIPLGQSLRFGDSIQSLLVDGKEIYLNEFRYFEPNNGMIPSWIHYSYDRGVTFHDHCQSWFQIPCQS